MNAFDRDEPAVRSPELAAFVDLARRQIPTPSGLRVDGVVRAARAHRMARTRRTVAVVMVAAAAVAFAWIGASQLAATGGDARVRDEASFDRASASASDGLEASEVHTRDEAGAHDDARPSATPAPLPAEPQPRVAPPHETSADAPPGPVAAHPGPKPARASADELAKAAERAMGRRRTNDAIALLEQIVREYPEHPATKAALLDLGRLRRTAGDVDHARCAYESFRKRWPRDAMGREVDKALAALGEGASCRGLRPSR